MTKKEKVEFVNDLIGSVKADLLKNIDKVPARWDGVELRYLIRDKFSGVVFGSYDDKRLARYKAYQNDRLTIADL